MENMDWLEQCKKEALNLPDDWCPLSDPIPEGWGVPVTILPAGKIKNDS